MWLKYRFYQCLSNLHAQRRVHGGQYYCKYGYQLPARLSGIFYSLKFSSAITASRYCLSKSSKYAKCSLSTSNTPITLLLLNKGTTISEREAELQAICPGNSSTS